MDSVMSNQAVHAMSNKHFVFAYDSEPVIDRTTGFPRSDHSTLVSTSFAPWSASEHSTFDEPSHSIESVRERRVQRENVRLVETTVIAGVAVFAAVLVALMR